MDLRIAKRIRAGRRAMIVVIKRQLRALGTALTLPSDYEQSRQATPLGTHHPTSGREAHSAEPAGPTFRRTQSLGAMRPDGGAERPAASPPRRLRFALSADADPFVSPTTSKAAASAAAARRFSPRPLPQGRPRSSTNGGTAPSTYRFARASSSGSAPDLTRGLLDRHAPPTLPRAVGPGRESAVAGPRATAAGSGPQAGAAGGRGQSRVPVGWAGLVKTLVRAHRDVEREIELDVERQFGGVEAGHERTRPLLAAAGLHVKDKGPEGSPRQPAAAAHGTKPR